jgi:WhiB family transcriptional regulator, redox-sensing transcriptional regulator
VSSPARRHTRADDAAPGLLHRERDRRGDEVERADEEQRGGSSPLSATRDWRTLAACRHADPELFFPPGRDDLAAGQVAAAKAVCARCPVCRECLAFAIAHRQHDGIWGGLTELERRRWR